MTRMPPSAWTALALLTGVNLLNYLDRYIPAGAMPLILEEFDATDTQGGLVQSMFMLPFALVAPLAGMLGDRRRRFAIAGAGVLVWSAATFCSGLAPTLLALLAARALIGVGEASYTVVTPPLIGDYFPAERRSRALSIFYAALPVGSALGFAVGSGIGSALGWRWAFFLAGVPGAVLALVLIALRDPPRGQMEIGRDRAGASWRALLERRSYVFNVTAQVIYTFAIGGLATWMPTYFVRERGLPLGRAGLLFGAVLCGAGFLGTIIGGQLAHALAKQSRTAHFTVAGTALVASFPFTLLAILAPSPAIFWPAMFVTLTLLFFNTAPLGAAMTNVLPPAIRGRGFGIYTMAIHIFGDAISPLIIGIASDLVGLRLPVLVTGLLLVPSGLVLLAGRRALARDLDGGRDGHGGGAPGAMAQAVPA